MIEEHGAKVWQAFADLTTPPTAAA
jgi:hypothetical protein